MSSNPFGVTLKKTGLAATATATTTTQPVINQTTTTKTNSYLYTTTPPTVNKSSTIPISQAITTPTSVPPVRTTTTLVPPPPNVPPPPGAGGSKSIFTSSFDSPASTLPTTVPVPSARTTYPQSKPPTSYPLGSLEYYQALCNSFPIIETGYKIGPHLVENRGTAKQYTSSGSSKLLITTKPTFKVNLHTEKTYDKRGLSVYQYTVPVDVGTEEKLYIDDVQMFYKNKSGSWVPLADVRVGNDLIWYGNFDIKVRPRYVNTLFFKGEILLSTPPKPTILALSDHESLPQPLTFRVLITDSNKQQKEICVDRVIGDSSFGLNITEERMETTRNYAVINGQKVSKSVYCDDVFSVEKIFLSAYIYNWRGVNSLAVSVGSVASQSSGSETTFTADKEGITKLETEASNSKIEVLPKSGNNCSSFELLFDKNTGYKLYGIKMKLKSNSGSVEQVVMVRDIVDVLFDRATLQVDEYKKKR